MIVTEMEALGLLHGKVLLVEPKEERRSRHLPVGLAKVATHIKSHGGSVTFTRAFDGGTYDAIVVSGLFSYEYGKMAAVLDTVRMMAPDTPTVIGGVLATNLTSKIEKDFPWARIYVGLSPELDKLAPDYSIDWQEVHPWPAWSIGHTHRGCPKKCSYCIVSAIEGAKALTVDEWTRCIDPSRKNILLYDNSLTSCDPSHVDSVTRYLEKRNLGVTMENGVEAATVTEEMAGMLARMRFVHWGCRTSFDRIEDDGPAQLGMERLIKAGVKPKQILAYILFNFTDTPKEAAYRIEECKKLGVHLYPMRYVPRGWLTRQPPYISKKWEKSLTSAFRHYGLMASYWTKMTFEEFARSDKCKGVTEEGWDKWNSQ